MTRYAFFLKWFWYAVAAIPVWLTEDLIFSRFSFFGITPLLLPLAVVTVAVLEGAPGGAGFGLAVGLWWAAALPGTRAGTILLSTFIGLLSGLISQYRLKQSYIGCLFCTAFSLMLLSALRLIRLCSGPTLFTPALLRIAGLELLVTLIFVAPIYLLFRLVYDRVGGTKLV